MNKAMRNEKGQFVKISTYAVDLSYDLDLSSKERAVILIDVKNPCAESINEAIECCISKRYAKVGLRVVRWQIESITKL